MKNYIAVSLVCSLLVITVSHSVFAEDLDTIFGRVKEYVTAKNYSKALEELQWAEKEVQKQNAVQLQSFFPDSVAGFSGGKFESTNALGISNIERPYSKDGQKVKLSLVGGSGGGAGLGGLAAFGKMAAMFGGQAGMDSVRIAGRTAQIQEGDGATPEITIFLDSGSMLKIESTQGTNVNTTTLRSIAEAIQIDSLDNYLRGVTK